MATCRSANASNDCGYEHWGSLPPFLTSQYSKGDLCGTLPEHTTCSSDDWPYSYDTLDARTESIPSFVLDTAFRVVDGEADSTWIATVDEASDSVGSQILAGWKVVANVLPFANYFTAAYTVLSAAGIDIFAGSSQPLTVDLTSLLNKLKENILDIEDQDDFLDTLDWLADQYTSASTDLKLVSDLESMESKQDILQPLLVNLRDSFVNKIQVEDYVEKYAFFMVEPLVTHASLHYSTVLLSVAARMNTYAEDGDSTTLDDTCVFLTQFQEDMETYQTWLADYRGQAWTDRLTSIPDFHTCDDDCSYQTNYTTYTWKDEWPLLGMSEWSEGWESQTYGSGNLGCIISRGTYTDGTALQAEILAYSQDMSNQVWPWLESLTSALDTMAVRVTKLVDECSESSVARTSVNTFI